MFDYISCVICQKNVLLNSIFVEDEQIANLFTKPLKQPFFEKRKMGMCRYVSIGGRQKIMSYECDCRESSSGLLLGRQLS